MGTLCFYLVNVCYFDYRYRKIPNFWLFFMLVAGLAKSVFEGGINGCIFFLIVMAAVMLALYPFFKIKALGAGDVKLFGVCSGYFSYDRVLYFLFFALLIAVGLSLVILLFQRDKKEYLKKKIPLGGPILGSVLLYMGGVY